MRRITMVFTAAALLALMMVASAAAPAMANDLFDDDIDHFGVLNDNDVLDNDVLDNDLFDHDLFDNDDRPQIDSVGAIPEDDPCKNIEDHRAKVACMMSQPNERDKKRDDSVNIKCLLAMQMYMNKLSNISEMTTPGSAGQAWQESLDAYGLKEGDC